MVEQSSGTEETSVLESVVEIIATHFGVDRSEITSGTKFKEDLNADSLDTVEIVMSLEEEFEITIPDEEAEKITTVGGAVAYILEHCPGTV